MLAEIHHKISKNGSNLSDRLEDKLTGDFFGAIRYIPFENGLKQVLKTAAFEDEETSQQWQGYLNQLSAYDLQVEFWPRHDQREIDLLLSGHDVLIGIEVKYLSGLSSDDDDLSATVDYSQSQHQLARYSFMLEQLAQQRETYLLFLAPFEMMNTVQKDLQKREILAPSVHIGFMNWQDIHQELSLIDRSPLEQGHKLILNDLQNLLLKKELFRFPGFINNKTNQPVSDHAFLFVKETVTWNWPDYRMEGMHYEFKQG